MNKDRLIGKKVVLRNVHCIDIVNGLTIEECRDVTGLLEKIGNNDFFGWEISAKVDGNSYELKTLSQIQPIYR